MVTRSTDATPTRLYKCDRTLAAQQALCYFSRGDDAGPECPDLQT